MIQMNPADLTSQAGMERAIEAYLAKLAENRDGTFNGMLEASLHSCDFEKRWLILRIDSKPWMENPNNVVHGGVSAAMLDMTMGTLTRYFTGGGMTPTVSMQVNYLHPVPVNAPIYLLAELPMLGRTLCHATGLLWAGEERDRPLCTATGVYYAGPGTHQS